jgi:hypothetical protein
MSTKSDLGGRKLFDGKDENQVIQKLEEVFALGGTDLEACLYANISKTAFYEWQKENIWFLERKEKLKETPMLKARRTIIENLGQPEHAKWYLERKNKNEFAQRTEMTGKEGRPINLSVIKNLTDDELKAVMQNPEELDKIIEREEERGNFN